MFTPALPILTERLALRQARAEDLDLWAALEADPEVVRYLYIDVMPRERSAERLAAAIPRVRFSAEHDAVQLIMERRDTGAAIGHVLLAWTSEIHRAGEIGWVLAPAHVGHGYATEAARALLALGFDGLGLHRIVARADARNHASVRVMRRLGMRLEAHLVENEWIKGEWTDEVIAAILEDEWRSGATRLRAPA
ncbi:MAG: GNAT family protein [Chloroflexota bacterium]